MAVRRLAEQQPESFAFTPENLAWAKGQIAKFPPGRQASAVIPLLWRAQEQNDYWLPRPAIEYVAAMLDMPVIRVMEVATFYTMFNLEPVGRHFIQLCGTTPCRLRGAGDLIKVCEERIGPQHHVTADGNFSWLEVECLGACCNAPMVQINNDYYEDLTAESFAKLLDDLAAGRPVKPGPQNGRISSEPLGGPTSLTDPTLFDGSVIGAWRKRFEEEAAAAAASAETDAARPADTRQVTAERAAAEGKPAAPVAPATQTSPTPARAGDSRAETKALETPLDRTEAGKAPVAPAAQADAANAGKTLSAKPTTAEGAAPAAARKSSYEATPNQPVSDEHKPALLAAPEGGKADDLELIWGVGPKLAEMLHRMGVFHFSQIASWSDENLRWVDQNLGAFKGRAVRDKWIEQAKKLASGWRPEKSIGDRPAE
jgi:NADH-quinone oxidoreductase subunit E